MTSLDFLYIALGGGFLILVVFISVLILYVTFLVRDVSKITEDVREVTDKVKDTVFEPLKALTEITSSFSFITDFVEKIKARYAEHLEDVEETDVEPDKSSKKKEDNRGKSGFMVKKLNK